MAHLLTLKDFHYYYGNIHAVKGVDLHIDEGEMVTLIGSNGAGKTTTMQAISGLLSPAGIRGEISFEGRKINGLTGHKIFSLGIAQSLEGRHVFAKLSVAENLMIGAGLRKDHANVKKDLDNIYQKFPPAP